jgi:hypothetical protein
MPITQLSGYRKGGSVLEKNEQLMVTDISNLIDGVNAIPVTPASLTFSGIFTQSGPSAPNYIVIQSGITPAGTNYGVVGQYDIIFATPVLTSLKTEVSVSNGYSGGQFGFVSIEWVSTTMVRIQTRNAAGTLANGILDHATVVIKVLA